MRVELESSTASEARREALQKYPQGGQLTGYAEGVAVYISTVRPRGDKSHVATAVRNRSPRATSFLFVPNPNPQA